jgi:sarcosine oxidase gamma subunit
MTIRSSLPVEAAASALVVVETRPSLAVGNVKEDNHLNLAHTLCYALHQSPEGGLSQGTIQLFEITPDPWAPLSAMNSSRPH